MAFSSIDEFRFGELHMSDDVENDVETLKACERYIESINLNCLDQFSLEKRKKTIAEYILFASNIVDIVISYLERVQSLVPLNPLNKLGPLLVILKMITNVIKIYFHKDIASIIIQHFHEIMSEKLSIRCLATCQKISCSLSYVENMPDTDDIGQKRLHLQLLSSDFPVHDALTDVMKLGNKIQHMVEEDNFTKFKELAYLFQLYCTLSTFTEMYLLHRIAVMSKYGEDASPINAVLKQRREDDKKVLNIVYRPTKRTLELYLNCELDKWPILNSFLARRKLLSESISYDKIRMFEIRPLNNQTKCITYRPNLRGKYCLVLTDSTENKKKIGNNLFIFKPNFNSEVFDNSYSIYATSNKHDKMSEQDGYIFDDSIPLITSDNPEDKWHILKIFPESKAETQAYMIRLADDRQKYLCLSWWNNIYVTTCTKPVEKFLWTFHMKFEQEYPYAGCSLL